MGALVDAVVSPGVGVLWCMGLAGSVCVMGELDLVES